MRPAKRTPWWRSFRLRIALAVALVSLAVMSVVGVVVDYQSAISGRERLRSQALERLSAGVAVLESTAGRTVGHGVSPSEVGVPQQLIRRVRQTQDRATYFDGTDMWAAQASMALGADSVLNVRVSGSELRGQTASLRRSLVLAGVPATVLAGLLGWLAASGLSRRLRRGAAVIERAGPDGRLPEPVYSGGRDEVATLTQAVDELADSLAERIERERRFSADVAHELRTPMTALVSAAELLDPADPVSDLVRKQTARLRRLIEDLLELFRAEGGVDVELESIDLAEAVTSSLSRWTGEPPALAAEPSASVRLDQRRLDRIVTNLLANAAAHGGTSSIQVRGATVTFTDDGPGYPESILKQGPRRFLRESSAPGSGLGLSIAFAQAEAMGAQLDLLNVVDSAGVTTGAQAVLSFGGDSHAVNGVPRPGATSPEA